MQVFLKLALLLLFFVASPLHAADGPTLFVIGDSTVSNQSLIPAQPLRGWAQMLPLYLKDDLKMQNHAKSGQSSRSFFLTERWQPVLDQLKAGDFVIIQFGHNDSKPDEKRHTEPQGEYRDNLLRFIRETREQGATPVLATSPC
ncbi:MAG: pectin esterase, partial [Verrucomicrobiaceae bacterium]|nr:pectin esterase [Verrucomicrobiaceae bacterium]